jgi:hypothetical protein
LAYRRDFAYCNLQFRLRFRAGHDCHADGFHDNRAHAYTRANAYTLAHPYTIAYTFTIPDSKSIALTDALTYAIALAYSDANG